MIIMIVVVVVILMMMIADHAIVVRSRMRIAIGGRSR